MRRRGLTMIETLLAIALLTLIVAAAASWTAMVGRFATNSVAPAAPPRKDAVIQAVFGLIQRDLLTGDFEMEGRRDAVPPIPRVQINEGVLEIRGRANSIHRYLLDRTTHVLHRVVIAASGPSTSTGPRVLLHGVHDFTVTLDEDSQTLDVAIELLDASADPVQHSPATHTLTRRFNRPW